MVTTLAGSAGAVGSADGTGSAARFSSPFGVAVDGAGNVYVGEGNDIRKVTPAGAVTTLREIAEVPGSADGTGSAAGFNGANGVAVDSAGNVYVADTSNCTIRMVTPAGVVTTLAGSVGACESADGAGSAARFNNPFGVAVDSGGNVYVGDKYNDTIRKVTPAGVVTTLAGSAGLSGSSDGTGSTARFWGPSGVALDSAGDLYVADTDNCTIRKVTPTGVVTTLVGVAGDNGMVPGPLPGVLSSPWGVAVDPTSGALYISVFSAILQADLS